MERFYPMQRVRFHAVFGPPVRVTAGAWLFVAAILISADAAGQSVADVARKSKKESEGKKAAIVITEDHLPSQSHTPPANGRQAIDSSKSAHPLALKYREQIAAKYCHYLDAQLELQIAEQRRDSYTIRLKKERRDRLLRAVQELAAEAHSHGVPPDEIRRAIDLGIKYFEDSHPDVKVER